jgi:hypothetical protein
MAATLPVRTWLSNACAVLLGRHGQVTRQATDNGCSRQTAYHHAAKVEQAVADAQLPGPCRDTLADQVQRLQEENRQLWAWLEHTIDCPDDKRRQFAVTAAAMGLSLRQTLALLAILLPAQLLPSRATLGRWVQGEGRRAARLLEVLDRACRSLVLCLCLDEIFFRRKPVLMGVEPYSMAWLLGRRAADRSGPTWAQALAAWPAVCDVAADGGSGLKLGLDLAARQRRQDADKARTQATPLHVRLDVFHSRREGERAVRLDWRQAEALWDKAVQLEGAKARFDRGGTDRRAFSKGAVAKAWTKALAAYAQAESKEQAWKRAAAALAVLRPDGQLNDRAWAEGELRAATAALSGPRWAKAVRMLRDERTLTFLDRLHADLEAAEPRAAWREALVQLWRWRRVTPARSAAALGLRLWESACQRLGEGWEESYRRLRRLLEGVLRASSAVECVNSVLRMHQGRHRTLTQELLDLKRLYWNCRGFVSGRRRGRCPYAHLGLKLPSYDLWDLLRMDPKELEQKLSSPVLVE